MPNAIFSWYSKPSYEIKLQNNLTKADESANKTNVFVLVAKIFLVIGISFIIIASLSLNGFLFSFTQITPNTILGAGGIFAIFSSIIFGKKIYDDFLVTIDCNPKDYGIIGSQNIDNDCWLNSMMQMLLNCNNLKENLKSDNSFKKYIDQYDASLKEGNKIPNPQKLKRYISGLCPTEISDDGTMQDLHGPLTAILKRNLSRNKNLKNTLYTTNVYKLINNEIKNSEASEEDNYGFLNLPITKNSYTLADLLNSYFFSKQNTSVRAGNYTKTLIEEQRQLAFSPQDLFVNVQRYVSNKSIAIPRSLTIDKKFFRNNTSASYQLDGFCKHLGNHYIAYIKKNGLWFYISDETVYGVKESVALKAALKANVFHFKKI